jgi:dTDP-glucose 4,6-dehydratase
MVAPDHPAVPLNGFSTLECPVDSIMQEDLEAIAGLSSLWEPLRGSTILVTGATGLIGSQLVKAIACRNRIYGTGVRVMALARSEEKANAILGDLKGRPEIMMVYGDLLGTFAIAEDLDYIIHCAGVTNSRYFVSHPVDTIRSIMESTRVVLAIARDKRVKSMVFLSSLEIYGVTDPGIAFVKESDSGMIDCMNTRSSYPEGKRLAECLCASYAAQYGVQAMVARLSQTFGPGVTFGDERVFAQFARSAIEKKDIILRTRGETIRNYCYTSDAITALLTILERGKAGEAYNVANRATVISIKDMARMVINSAAGTGIKVAYAPMEDIEKMGYAPVVRIRLDPSKLEGLGWVATYGLEQMFQRTIQSMILSSGLMGKGV